MRLRRLSLHRYGHFAGCDLDFPHAEKDFHLIFGNNEAGKSTTLSAVSDLLFGFPHSTAYDFRFDAPLLRVGATLEHAGQTLALRRRKGKKDTLLDDAETPIGEGPLTAMLQGFSAESFRISHSLDHHRLRDGGRGDSPRRTRRSRRQRKNFLEISLVCLRVLRDLRGEFFLPYYREPSPLIITVRLFAVARERAGRREIEVEIPDGATVADLRRALGAVNPALAELLPMVRIAVAGEYAADDLPIPEGAEVAVIPPVSGGAER